MSAEAGNVETEGVIIRPMLTIDRAIDAFLARGFKETTRARYSRILDRFADRYPRDWDVSKVTEEDCLAFVAGYRHRAVGTQAHAEAVVASFFGWLYRSRKIKTNPMDRVERTRRIPAGDLDVVTVSSKDVPKLLLAAKPGTELNTIAIAAYLGARRRAIASLRLRDYDRENGRIRFHEKGGKTIWKPVPAELERILGQSIRAGQIVQPDDYLVPPEGPLLKAERDDRVIWRVVKRVAARAGVEAHVHALRAAFAVYFLETHGRDAISLQELMGHSSFETTKVYLRKMDKAAAMEQVRDLSWAEALRGSPVALSNGPGNDVFDAPSYVYFISAGSAMKIGYAGDPLARMRDLQSFHHEELKLLVAIPGDFKTEREYHDRFAADRLRGEWFRTSPDLLKLVASLENHPEAIRMEIAGNQLPDSAGVGAGGFEPPSPDSQGTERPGTQHDLNEALTDRLPRPQEAPLDA